MCTNITKYVFSDMGSSMSSFQMNHLHTSNMQDSFSLELMEKNGIYAEMIRLQSTEPEKEAA